MVFQSQSQTHQKVSVDAVFLSRSSFAFRSFAEISHSIAYSFKMCKFLVLSLIMQLVNKHNVCDSLIENVHLDNAKMLYGNIAVAAAAATVDKQTIISFIWFIPFVFYLFIYLKVKTNKNASFRASTAGTYTLAKCLFDFTMCARHRKNQPHLVKIISARRQR